MEEVLERTMQNVRSYIDTRTVLKYSELHKLLKRSAARGFGRGEDLETAIERLEKNSVLRRITLSSPYGNEVRFCSRKASHFAIGLSLKTRSYLSHQTACELHSLIPPSNTIYINREQSPKTSNNALTQDSIHKSFQNKPRESKYVLRAKGAQHKFVVLSGKATGDLGVEQINYRGETLRVTGLERTLIDIAVRPVYCGGPQMVSEVFQAAIKKVSCSSVTSILKRLGYLYPYHQCIGFYLQRAGATQKDLKPLQEMGMEFDFYLAHGMRETTFIPEWRVHVPRKIAKV
jgi:predicted transcriptional regulator of viral defense system